MATKSKKPAAKKAAAKAKPAAKSKPAAKKPAAKSAKPAKSTKSSAKPAKAAPATKATKAAPATGAALAELDAARATIMRITGELNAARADGERFQADHERSSQQARDQQVELDQLRAESLKTSVDLAAAQRKAEEATRAASAAAGSGGPSPADAAKLVEANRRADEATRKLDEATRKADEAARKADEATRKLDEITRKAEDATRRADEAGRRADEADRRAIAADRERGQVAGELSAARAELGGYKLRCPKCGKNFAEESYEGITIDRCTGCDAVYFDAGEVDQLIAKVHEKMASPTHDAAQTSGWFRNMFKRKPKPESPPSA